MLKTYLLICISIISLTSFSQIQSNQKDITVADSTQNTGDLELTNKSNQKSVVITEGSKVIIFTNENKKIKGILSIINDSTVNIDGQSVNINEIKQIEVKKGSATPGIILTVFSVGLITGGVIMLFNSFNSSNLISAVGLGVIGVASGVSGAVLLIPGIIMSANNFGEHYKKTEWEFNINSTPNNN